MNELSVYALAFVATLIILTAHEYAHGYAAYRLGDPTARNLGRLTLNPLKHLDPIGTVCMVLFHFGGAKPVPIDLRYFKKPRRDFALTALAGPAVNLLLAFFTAPLYLLLYRVLVTAPFPSELSFHLAYYSFLFVSLFHSINLGIAVFNLLPIPPLDGSRLLGVLLPPRLYYKIMRHERTIYLILLLWLASGGLLSNVLLRFPAIAQNPVLSTLSHILSLSWLLGGAIDALSELMLRLWALIPGLAM